MPCRVCVVLSSLILVLVPFVESIGSESSADSLLKQLETLKSLNQDESYSRADSLATTLRLQFSDRWGAESKEVADLLNVHLLTLYFLGELGSERGLRMASESVSILETLPDAKQAQARSLQLLARAQWDAGLRRDSLPTLRRELDVRWEADGSDRDLAGCLQRLIRRTTDAELHGSGADLDELVEKARRVLGEANPELTFPLFEYARYKHHEAAYTDAEEIYAELMRLLATAEDQFSRWTFQVHNELGNLYEDTGRWSDARSHFERAHSLLQAQPEHDTGYMAEICNNLGVLHTSLQNGDEARDWFEKALELNDANDGMLEAIIMRNLADLERVEGKHDAALRNYDASLDLMMEAVGDQHDNVATVLRSRGQHWARSGDPQRAIQDLEQAFRIRESVRGSDHPDMSLIRSDLGDALCLQGELSAAADRYTEALGDEETESILNPSLRSRLLVSQAYVHAWQGEHDAAMQSALSGNRVMSELRALTAPALSEREALQFAERDPGGIDLAMTLCGAGAEPEIVWNAAMRSRASVLDEAVRRLRSASEYPELRTTLAEYRKASGELGDLLAASATSWDSLIAARIEITQRKVEALDRQIGVALAEKGVRFASPCLGSLVQGLPTRTALVGIFVFEETDLREPGIPGVAGTAAYGAFCTRSGSEEVTFARLGEKSVIDGLVNQWREKVSYPSDGKRQLEALEAAGSALRKAVWDPLSAQLPDVDTVFLVPDGRLSFVAYAALPNQGSYLALNGPAFQYLVSERDLLDTTSSASTTAEPKEMLAIGGVAFGNARDVGSNGGASSRCRLDQFEALPGTLREVEELADTWDALGPQHRSKLLSGSAATESAFKSLASSYDVIHVATHGFFLSDCRGESPVRTRGISGFAKVGSGPQEAPPRSVIPGLSNFSGLAFSGVNEDTSEAEDDGVLTAQEVSTLDLSKASWVVLSACDTGVGEESSGEGIIGLRRAFAIAGARALVMSLWSVEDESAREWMTALYRHRFSTGLESYKAAAEATRDVLHRRQKEGESTHPFYWAGFVTSGSWN